MLRVESTVTPTTASSVKRSFSLVCGSTEEIASAAIKIVSPTSMATGCQPSFMRSSKLVLMPAAAMAVTSSQRELSLATCVMAGVKAPMVASSTSTIKASRKPGTSGTSSSTAFASGCLR